MNRLLLPPGASCPYPTTTNPFTLFCCRSALVFDNLPKAEALRAKLHEFSAVVAAAPGGASLAVEQAEQAALDTLLAR